MSTQENNVQVLDPDSVKIGDQVFLEQFNGSEFIHYVAFVVKNHGYGVVNLASFNHTGQLLQHELVHHRSRQSQSSPRWLYKSEL